MSEMQQPSQGGTPKHPQANATPSGANSSGAKSPDVRACNAKPRDAVPQGMTVYYISVVAQMVETHPQTLRMYERMGLVVPSRTRNNVRLYSESDVEQVKRIQHLTQQLGVNLAGVEVVFKLLAEMQKLRDELDELRG